MMPTSYCKHGCLPIEVATEQDGSDWLWQHNAEKHRGQPATAVQQFPTVDWHAQAMLAIRALAMKGTPFVISEVIRYGVPDAPNPRTDWARVQGEAEALGWIEQTNELGHSVRPTTKRSACAKWKGTYAMTRPGAA